MDIGDREDYSTEAYRHPLTESIDAQNSSYNAKWTFFLTMCCLAACTASFQFGYNIGSTNLPTELIQNFFVQNYFPDKYDDFYLEKKATYDFFNKYIENDKMPKPFNITLFQEELNLNLIKINQLKSINITNEIIDKLFNSSLTEERLKTDMENYFKEINEKNKFLWIITNCCFVVGGMLGAFTSKYVVDFFGRKNGIMFHNLFTLLGSLLVLVAKLYNFPSCVLISRFFFGVQGGMMCGLIPTYLNEISPKALRGATGVLSQLFITVGILVAQTLGFRQFLGTKDHWHILLALPIVPSVIGSLALCICFPESPKALLINEGDEKACRKALHKLRNTRNVSHEIEQMHHEARDSQHEEAMSIWSLLKSSELRWPLLTGLILNITQQLCGINAIFFYSDSIFKRASIEDEYIQYAVFATGLVNVISTIAVVPLIDRLGRKPLLIVPMFIMIADFIALTICLYYKKQSIYYSYMSIVCIIVFIICFAVGLGPIPFIYVAECFTQESRSAALAICMFANWVANLVLTLAFQSLQTLLTDFTFLVFTVIVAVALMTIMTKVPETKGRNVEEIMEYFDQGEPTKYKRNRDIQMQMNPNA